MSALIEDPLTNAVATPRGPDGLLDLTEAKAGCTESRSVEGSSMGAERGKFRIADLTREQLEALKLTLASDELDLRDSIKSAEAGEAFWLKRAEEGRASEADLAQCRENLLTFRRRLADNQALVPIVYGAKFIAAPARRRTK
jgi:hypothetical protein